MQFTDAGIFIDDASLANFARNTASAAAAKKKASLRGYAAEVLRAAYSLRKYAKGLEGSSGAPRWLLDNGYIAEREARDAARTLKRAGRLPTAVGGNRPAVADCAGELVSAGRGFISEKRLKLFLREYQRVRPLGEKELWLFITVLKAELTLFLSRIAADVDNGVSEEVLKNVFDSYRLLSQKDLTGLIEEADRVEECLRRDPAGVYPHMDSETRAAYRRETAKLARKAGLTELDAAKRAVELAARNDNAHVGVFIFKKPLGRERKKSDAGLYIASNVILTAFLALLTGITLSSPVAALLTLLPYSEIVKNASSFILTRLKPPRVLFRMELKDGVPEKGRTIAVISTILSTEKDGEKYAGLIEEYRLLNRAAGDKLAFGILADLPESKSAVSEKDSAVAASARNAIEKLNRRYGGGFYLLMRGRELSPDGAYMGRERKRGAIRELARLLTGRETTLKVVCGDERVLRKTRFILTLDADTRLTFDSASELIGAALHPLNEPRISSGAVKEGFGIISPAVIPELEAAVRSDFSRIFAGLGGIDPYGSAASELYWDNWAEATFTGKGLINAEVYSEVLDSAFPDNTLLSHDIIEGAYLGCALAADTAVTDGFPFKLTSYYMRLDRWTRGDWQNIRYLFPKLKDRAGNEKRNPLSELSKWKIFDNLRRSLAAPAAFIAVISFILFGGRALAVSAAVALLMDLSGLLATSLSSFIRHDGTVTARFHSPVLHGFWGVLARTGTRLVLLPAEAWTLARAAGTAVFRMTVSRRNLMRWVTSSEAEKRYGNTLWVNVLRLCACPIAGLAAILLGGGYLSLMLGLVWLSAPVFAWALSAERREKTPLSAEDRSFVLSCAGDIWRWFEDHLNESDHWLPPDNVQLEPPAGIAHRTSPTNIGLGLLSVVSACDLGLCGESEAKSRLEKMLGTMEKLPKWRGHFYNWYDTQTLMPLEPAYVSSVDSGNLAACLIAAGQAALELGMRDTAERLYALLADMDFTPLYDSGRELFRIGIALPSGEPSESVYDLLSSEARLLSYVATALGTATRKHWRRLGRTMVSFLGYRGMASWTGTMFEYLMPELLLPEYPASLIYETSRFAVFVQRKTDTSRPWGASESGYYGFSHGLVYRYKAHGAPALALNREVVNEGVISPYSSFLCLGTEGKRAIKNLKKLAGLGALGPYGFYEAADFSTGGCDIVKSYMAHHLGMSLVSCGNVLTGGRMRERFMRDPRMRAYSELLKERLPVGAITITREKRKTPEKPSRCDGGAYSETVTEPDALVPRAVPLSNGRYNLLVTETGKCRSQTGELDVTRWDPYPLGASGMRLILKTDTDEIPLMPADTSGKVRYGVKFSSGSAVFSAEFGDISATVSVFVPDGAEGETRRITLRSKSGRVTGAKIIAWFEPVLLPKRDFDSHPAFWKLCMESRIEKGALLIRRRQRGELREKWLALYAGDGARYFSHMERGKPPEKWQFRAYSPENCAGAEIVPDFSKGEAETVISLGAGDTQEEALAEAVKAAEAKRGGAITRLDASALMLGMGEDEVREAVGLITPLVFPTARVERKTAHKKSELWRLGISGDRPLLAALVNKPEDAQKGIRLYALLRENGIGLDLALVLTEGGDYFGKQGRAAQSEMDRIGALRDGVHLIGCGADGDLVFSLADAVVGERAKRGEAVPVRMEKEPVFTAGGVFRYKYSPDGSFEAAMLSALPPASWSNILTNGSFGYIATECGTGHMWSGNARERQLTPWNPDHIGTAGAERLSLMRDGKEYSLFADGGEIPTLVRHGFGWTAWERDIDGVKTKVTAFIPEGKLLRVLIIELSGAQKGDKIRYSARLRLGNGALAPKDTVMSYENGVLSASSDLSFFLSASREPTSYTGSLKSLLQGKLDSEFGKGENACAAAEYEAEDGLVIACGSGGLGDLRALTEKNTALESLNAVKRYWKERLERFSFSSGEGKLEQYASGWAAYQTLASRLLGRTGAYQLGGAYGFRDQLQDAVNLLPTEPELTAEMLLLAASHQYSEGDVMHWWHPSPEGDKGVRTRCSDDLMWLPWALSEYALKTGDLSICRRITPFLSSPPLGENETDRYEAPKNGAEGTLLEHAERAADAFLSRGFGMHGLPKMLGGDWNDGMNEIKGESVWLAFFGALSLRGLAAVLSKTGEREREKKYSDAAERLLRAGEDSFSKDRFVRAYFENGEPVGAEGAEECEIDSVAQSFAVFAGAERELTDKALETALRLLYDRDKRLVKLFTPPFCDGGTNPGYIRSYAPGFRENGGQYTHAAVWLAISLLDFGREEEGTELLEALLPSGRSLGEYIAEPYVLAGDVYANPSNEKRGGWSWYTGAAGWYLRAVREHLLGLKLRDGRLYIEPHLPQRLMPVRAKLFDISIEIDASGIRVNGEAYDPGGYRLRKFNNNLISKAVLL
ncbi:MAG: hypothetical protein IJS72_04170 [Oscillospiraceae bacterium]|nr:hypothetical protein [Oscillospiraceae bacterium]